MLLRQTPFVERVDELLELPESLKWICEIREKMCIHRLILKKELRDGRSDDSSRATKLTCSTIVEIYERWVLTTVEENETDLAFYQDKECPSSSSIMK